MDLLIRRISSWASCTPFRQFFQTDVFIGAERQGLRTDVKTNAAFAYSMKQLSGFRLDLYRRRPLQNQLKKISPAFWIRFSDDAAIAHPPAESIFFVAIWILCNTGMDYRIYLIFFLRNA